MKKLLVFLKPYTKECILSPMFKMFEAIIELFVPLVVASIIDNGIAYSQRGYVGKMTILLVVMGLVGLAISITAQYFAAKAACGFAGDLRHVMFSHIKKLSYSQIDNIGVSGLITRLTGDVNQVQNGVNLTLRLLLRSPFVVFGAMIMAFFIDIPSALTFVVAILILFFVVFVIMLWGIPLYKEVQKKLDGVTSITRQSLNGARVVRAFCKQDYQTQEFDKDNKLLYQKQICAGKISALLNPATYIIINICIIFLINTGSVRVNEGNLSQGDVVALYNYMSYILVELIKFASLIISITKALASANRVSDVLEKKPDMEFGQKTDADTDKDSPYAIQFKNVSVKYHENGENALEDITFEVKRGQTLGVIGGTGSGKTTLVNLIPRFYDVCKGEVIVDGVNVKEYTENGLRQKIGVVPQKAVLFAGSIRENMRFKNEFADDEAINKALEIAQAKEFVDDKGGLDFAVEKSGGNLSGGQKQRLCIARAMVGNPDILILDDSSSALDYATDAALRSEIRKNISGSTIVIVSQRAMSVMNADLIVVLEDGKAVGIGTHDELLENCDVYREIYDSQFRNEVQTHE